ncbi:hypothetical protein BP5796_09712 [Coleophoma crateriformis]|uniref:Uncharacterized protein n=1 Tax=Coleophoma crateriformis TaxID=565419 RepID=A0A3D8QYQ9_9HELO|nr:hypothetical protein BP5796_09712 [Coleophoma crateriformis]
MANRSLPTPPSSSSLTWTANTTSSCKRTRPATGTRSPPSSASSLSSSSASESSADASVASILAQQPGAATEDFEKAKGGSGALARWPTIPGAGTGWSLTGSDSDTTPKYDNTSPNPITSPTHKSDRTQPIAIELPSAAIAARKKSLPVYTPEEPLSARGDLPGGYFPLHEDPTSRSYQPHPFNRAAVTSHPANMPSSSRSSADSTPKSSRHSKSTGVPGTLPMTMGKYHPSNYKITPVTSPGGAHLAPAGLAIPAPPSRQPSSGSSSSPTRHHHQKTSDAKKKLQQYQRDMIAQARIAASATSPSGVVGTRLANKPISPRLLPMGSPDELSAVMTPLELGDGAGGYLGARALGADSRESEMVGRMLRMEEDRRRREGQSSPAARV